MSTFKTRPRFHINFYKWRACTYHALYDVLVGHVLWCVEVSRASNIFLKKAKPIVSYMFDYSLYYSERSTISKLILIESFEGFFW